MATSMLSSGGIALVGAPDSDAGLKDGKQPPVQAMQVDITQDIVDELLESVRSGKSPQIIFGRTPQLKYGDKTHMLQSSTELHRYELYKSSGTGSDDSLEFAGLINHSLLVHKAEDVTAGVDSALEQLRSNMAAISEFKEANKTIVGDAAPGRTPAHRRFPSTGFKAHLGPSMMGSPLLSAPSSPMHKRPPTSQPSTSHDTIVSALRVPIIPLLAREPATEASLAATCRTSLAIIRDVLPKIAKRSTADADKWQLTDKSFREVNPFKFPYQSPEDRQQAIDGAIKSFDRQRLAKDDKLWQILLPRDQRGQGICLSRSTVKAPEAKPKAKASTPMHKISDLTKKKPVAKKAADKPAVEKKPKVAKEPEIKPKSSIKEKYLAREKEKEKEKQKAVVNVKEVKEAPTATAPTASAPSSSTPRPVAPSKPSMPGTDAPEIRTKKVPAPEGNSNPRAKPKMSGRESQRDRPTNRPFKPTMPINTKPKNPSPLSASPPVNASDFEDSHPVHKALAAAPSPAKTAAGNSDSSLKRKANNIDSDIHNHLAVKKQHVDRSTATHTPSHANSKATGSTPSSTSSVKRKSDDSSSSNTPSTASKVRKVANIDTGLASRYHHNNPRASPGASSTSTTSPSMPSLSFRQTVELSQKFQKYYKRYEELYWKLTEAEKPPTEAQRNDLLKMHKKLEEMKKEIKAGAGVHR
ncbi:hypothetical protein AA0111_g12312 [Alternaria arborescens]|uniref:hypothetical protein n=1 Tax=Alternaria arborescens TaxID=156630 RepID=UPI00107539D8|nr:hypothetical protein AA0111_g12312 [Alternaria arborescens]RYO13165.1 hypothetical protein AA0111_g12312 [Alternaria arborescens]